MDQDASRTQVAAPAAAVRASPDGLAPHIAEVEAARARLGYNLERLNTEVRAQVGVIVEKVLYKVAVAGAALVGGVAVRKLLTAGWRKARKGEPPGDPASPRTGWGEALTWTAATAVGAALAKLLAARGAAAGWERATGSPPPGVEV